MADVDVLVIGGGPAGLAAASALKRLGIERAMVIERETEAGGVPRHCGHPPFGWREYRRILTGPAYARRLVEQAGALGVEVRPATAAVRLQPGGRVEVTSPQGAQTIAARRVVIATGARETPRSARLIGGTRPLGVLTTGALQALVYLKQRIPFRRPVIVGTELVSLSALLTCRHAGIRPAAMIEAADRPTAPRPLTVYPRLFGIPIHYRSRIQSIEGDERVEAVCVDGPDGERTIACDGVLCTGRFVPEAALLRGSDIALDAAAGGPLVDQYGRCSDPVYFAAGNVLRPIETAGWSWQEGCDVARVVADDLAGRLPAPQWDTMLTVTPPVRLVVPQRLSWPLDGRAGAEHLQLRVERPVSGTLAVTSDSRTIWHRRMRALPERRMLIPVDKIARAASPGPLVVEFQESQTGRMT